MRRVSVALALLACAAPAWAEGTQVDRDGFRLAVPKGWVELPDVANTAANGVLAESTKLTGGAVAYGDRSAGVMVMVVWVEGEDEVQAVRPAVEAFLGEIRQSLVDAGTQPATWKVEEDATRQVVQFAWQNDEVGVRGTAVGAVSKKGRLRGWTAQCVHATGKKASKKSAARCDDALAGFAVTVAAAELKPLETQKKTGK